MLSTLRKDNRELPSVSAIIVLKGEAYPCMQCGRPKGESTESLCARCASSNAERKRLDAMDSKERRRELEKRYRQETCSYRRPRELRSTPMVASQAQARYESFFQVTGKHIGHINDCCIVCGKQIRCRLACPGHLHTAIGQLLSR